MLTQALFQYAAWEDLPDDYQAFFVQLTGNGYEPAQSLFAVYFYWFNIAHSMCHVLRKQYGTESESRWVSETAANEFAVAYWREFGENARLEQMGELFRDALRLLPNPIPHDEEPMAYFDANFAALSQSLPSQVYLQFRWIVESMERKSQLITSLQTFVTQQARPGPAVEPRFYPDLAVDLPLRIIPDMREFLGFYNVVLPPVQVVRSFSPAIQFVGFE